MSCIGDLMEPVFKFVIVYRFEEPVGSHFVTFVSIFSGVVIYPSISHLCSSISLRVPVHKYRK